MLADFYVSASKTRGGTPGRTQSVCRGGRQRGPSILEPGKNEVQFLDCPVKAFSIQTFCLVKTALQTCPAFDTGNSVKASIFSALSEEGYRVFEVGAIATVLPLLLIRTQFVSRRKDTDRI